MSEWEIPNEFSLPRGAELKELEGVKVNPISFEPPGPIGEAYVYGLDPIDFIMGPMGSAKTTCSGFRIPAVALRAPVCADGVIRVRGAMLHANFRALYRTTLPSLFRSFPRDFPGFTFEGGQDRPFRFTMRFRTPKGKALQIILDGFGIGEHAIEELLRGYECNFGICSEADLLSEKVPGFMYGRAAQGRYPGRAILADKDAKIPATVWGDLNPPVISHWVHELFVEKPRPGYTLRRQPSGLSDQAENRKYVSRDDYEKMSLTLSPDDVRRFVHGEFGLVGDGALVYSSFDHTIHVAKAPLAPLDLPIRLSFDAGGSPAMIVRQFTPKGHLRVLDELVTEAGTGVGRFCEYMIDFLQAKYRGLPVGECFGDPSAFYGADRMAGELSFMEIVAAALGKPILPTPTNEPQARQEAVDWFLRRGRDSDGTPYFQVSPICKMIVGGFQGGFTIVLNPHDTASRVRFLKNKYSHPHEALQYGAYGDRGHAGLINDAARAGRFGNVTPIRGSVRVNSDFNP